MSSKNLFCIYQYWGQGINYMPDFLKIIYKHNREICKKNNIPLILLDDNNIYNYLTPHIRFKNLAYNFKSDIIRYYILHKYGGFWFDTDVIIIKDINKLYESLNNYECMLDIEFGEKIGCASLYIKKQSVVSKFCIDYINNILDTKQNLIWDDIGPNTIELLYKRHSSLILLNDYSKVKKGCNFFCWNITPGINKNDWYLESENLAERKAYSLKNNINCYYLITWTIYRINDLGDNLINIVFYDKRSVFYYFFVGYLNKMIIIKDLEDEEWNGVYFEGNVNFKDKDSISYVKDDRHHIYLYNGLWKLGQNGIKAYMIIENNISNKLKNTNFAVMWASTINLGDDIQTLAAINFLKKKGIEKYTFIDREKLSDYDGEPVKLIMNGWFMHNINKFPPSDKITPIFISVHIDNEHLISNNINYFKKYEPIGCRDQATANKFKKYGIDSYFTGCLTLLLDEVDEKTGGKYLVDINTKCNYIPNIEIDTLKYKDFNVIEHDINENYIDIYSIKDRLIITESLLNKYRKAELVITTRLHCILPCRAFNTKAIFIHKNYEIDPRFSGLKNIINGDTKIHNNKEGCRSSIEEIRNFFLLFKI